MNRWLYNVYGLNICSSIEIPQFIEVKEFNSDERIVNISYGIVPEKYKELVSSNEIIKVSKEEVCFYIKGIGFYYIYKGNEVIIQPSEDCSIKAMREYIMGSCLGFIMLQRDRLAIHGSTVSINDKAFIFTGKRGVGKTSLTTALRHKGHKLISDDVSAINIDKVPFVMPAFPYQKLCNDIMERYKYNKRDYEIVASDKEDKYSIPVKDQFINNSIEVKGIFEISVDNIDNISISKLEGKEKINTLIKNVYRGEYLNKLGGISPILFKDIIKIAANVEVYKIVRPKGKYTINEIIESIINVV